MVNKPENGQIEIFLLAEAYDSLTAMGQEAARRQVLEEQAVIAAAAGLAAIPETYRKQAFMSEVARVTARVALGLQNPVDAEALDG